MPSKEEAQRVWESQPPCEICGARPGRNPMTGVEVKLGHRDSCAFIQQLTGRGGILSEAALAQSQGRQTQYLQAQMQAQMQARQLGYLGARPSQAVARGPETAIEWLDRRVNEIRVTL